jgi:hypothetical protein
MNKAHTILGVAVAFCVLALIASPVTAALQKGEDSGRWGASGLLDRLEEQGCDVSGIRAAIEAGDQETARTLMQQFMEEHKDELPAPPEGRPEGHCKRHSTNQETVETDHRLGIIERVPGINPGLSIA